MPSLKNVISLILASSVPFCMQSVQAQTFPERTVTILVPFVPGGAFDVVARLAAERLSKETGQQFIVENKPGAGGTLGGRIVSQSKPDGYTLLLSGVGPISISPAVYKNLGYDPATALAPVIQLTTSPFVLVTSQEFKGKSLDDFTAFLKASPGKYNYASTGNGTLVHLAGEYFKNKTHTDFEHIPYSGGSQATLALMSGDATFSITNIPNVLSQIKAGKLVGVATTGKTRSSALPDLPTMAEAGLKDFELSGWIGIFAPAGTPEPIIESLNAAFSKVMENPEMKKRLEEQGDDVTTGSVAQFKQYVADSDAKWKQIATDANVSID
ncbi:tripartite tricarboxylate transporter substrate binding protein [Alcaligenaceae bacterium]|nr:tripartite tricarboxylate transporter substrate binding protein [Alcaligenaceae bacterium]